MTEMLTKYFYKLFTLKSKKVLRFSGIFACFFVLISFLTVYPVFAMDGMGGSSSTVNQGNMSPLMRFIEVDNPIYTPIDVSLDILGVVLMIIALVVIIKSVREYGKSTIGILLLYFLIAILVLGSIRLIFILDDDNIYSTKNITEMTAWHFLFYYAIIIFYIAGKTLTKLVASDGKKASYQRAIFLLIFTVVISTVIIIFLPSPAINSFFVQNLQNTWFNTFGWFHIIALVLSASISFYLYGVKNKFKGYTGMIGDIYISLGLLAAIHLWELLNESWHVITVSSNFGEFVERCLWIPVFIFILYSFIKLRRMATIAPATGIAKDSEASLAAIPVTVSPPAPPTTTQPPAS